MKCNLCSLQEVSYALGPRFFALSHNFIAGEAPLISKPKMQMHRPSLAPLEQRLDGLVQSLDALEPSIKSEPLNIDPSLPRYVCGECAWTTLKRQGLAIHFSRKHNPLHFTCPARDCKTHCPSQWDVDKHFQQQHAIPCSYPGCKEVFTGTSQLHIHLERNHPPGDANPPENGNPDTSRLFKCPWPGCRRAFPDNAVLFDHYDAEHPLSLYQPNTPKPYKCPFCSKGYTREKYMKAHQSSSHRPSRWATSEADGSTSDQQALIQQSHVSMARRASEARLGDPASVEDTFSESEELSDGEEEYSITIAGGRIYIDDELALSSPEPDGIGSTKPASSAVPQNSTQPNETMAIGYILQPPSSDHRMSDADDEEDYPERWALDEDELPREQRYSSPSHVADQFADPEQGRRILHRMLYILHLHQWISAGELMDLWSILLTSEHRVIILQQLHDINLVEDESKLLSILHGGVLSELINAWAQFKLLSLQYFPYAFPQNPAAKEMISAILGYCRGLEDLIDEGRSIAISQGYEIPDIVRRPPRDESSISGDASLARLIEGLADRVKCRMVHERRMQFTNVMILKETGPYIEDLKAAVRTIYPDGIHDEDNY